MDELITAIDKPVEFDLDIKNITPVPKYEKDHSRLENLDYESSGHTGFASSKDLEEVMGVASGKTRSFTLQSLSDLGSLFGIEISSVENKYTVTKSQITYNGETVTLANGYVFYIVDNDVPDYWFSKDDMALYATESQGGGIKTLVGTEEKPINLYTDLEINKLYLLKGNTSANRKMYDVLAYVTSAGTNIKQLLLQNYHWNNSSGGNNFSNYNNTILNVNTDGRYYSHTIIFIGSQFNNTSYISSKMFYSPTKGGTAGQILQSNGDTEPTWVDVSTAGLATTTDIEAAIGNVSALLGDTEDLEV